MMKRQTAYLREDNQGIPQEKKISQEDLCYNICSVSSYSRIERGEQIPEKKTIEAITSRLGITIMYYNDLGCSF
jgi:transcriptional regulator with XRE-family HTH domain